VSTVLDTFSGSLKEKQKEKEERGVLGKRLKCITAVQLYLDFTVD